MYFWEYAFVPTLFSGISVGMPLFQHYFMHFCEYALVPTLFLCISVGMPLFQHYLYAFLGICLYFNLICPRFCRYVPCFNSNCMHFCENAIVSTVFNVLFDMSLF